MKTKFYLLIVAVTCLVLGSGCKSVHWSKSDTLGLWAKKPKKSKTEEAGIPERMVVAWKDSVYEEQGVPMSRGFGGRFYFYDQENLPIQVDGELVIYGFDDSRSEKSNQADHKYVFTKEQLAQHFSESVLGPSYSIWLPWDAVGGEAKQVSLIPVFKASSGKIVRGDQTVNALQGKKSDRQVADNENHHTSNGNLPKGLTQITHNGAPANGTIVATGTMQVGYQEATINSPRIRSTTINVPNDTAQRLARTPPSLTARQTLVPNSTRETPHLNANPLKNLPPLPSSAPSDNTNPDSQILEPARPSANGRSPLWSMPPKSDAMGNGTNSGFSPAGQGPTAIGK